MRRRWASLLDGASRAFDLAATAFFQRRPRSMNDLRLAADLITIRAIFGRVEHIGGVSTAVQVFVGSLPYEVTDDDLRQVFSVFGKVDAVRVIVDRDSGRSKGFAFVSAHLNEQVINLLDGVQLFGRAISVGMSRPKSDRPRRNFGQSLDAAAGERVTQSSPDPTPETNAAIMGSVSIRLEIISPGTEMAAEADRVLSGVGADGR